MEALIVLGARFSPKLKLCLVLGLCREELGVVSVFLCCLSTEPPLLPRILLLGSIVMEKQVEKLEAKILVGHLKAERTSAYSTLGFVMDKFPLRPSGRLS